MPANLKQSRLSLVEELKRCLDSICKSHAPSGRKRRRELIHGLDDHFVPIAQSIGFIAQARAGSVSVDYFELASVGHFALIDPRGSVWPLVALTALGR